MWENFMIELIKSYVDKTKTPAEQMHQLREALQILVLKVLYDIHGFKHLTFTGGTALRIVFQIPRYSEDLDFSLSYPPSFHFENIYQQLVAQLTQHYGLKLTASMDAETNVYKIHLKFSELLWAFKLSGHKNENLLIKIEIDIKPPPGGIVALSLLNQAYTFTVSHFDLPSLFATKLHDCFFRKYTKGRDVYDLIWYLARRVVPNFTLLNAAVLQTQKFDLGVDAGNFKDYLLKGINGFDMEKARADIERFLINKSELDLFKKETLKKVVESLDYV